MVNPQNPYQGQMPPGQPPMDGGQQGWGAGPGMVGPGPGMPGSPAFPEEIKLVGIFQLIAGILGALTFLSIVIGTLGCALFALTPLFAATVAGLEIYSGAKAVSGNPNPKKFFWFGLPIMGICAILGGDLWSCIVGILALVMLNKPHIKAWMQD